MKDQSIVLDSTMHARLLERARKCEIVLHSGAGPASRTRRRSTAASEGPRSYAHVTRIHARHLYRWISSSSHLSTYSTSSSQRPKVAQSHGKYQCSQSIRSSVRSVFVGFNIIYIAENHENLHHTLISFTVAGFKTGTVLHAEVSGRPLVIKSGPQSSISLLLSAHTVPGPKEVRAHSSHYEIKLMTESSRSPPPEDNSTPLLDATQLAMISHIAFLCASCSLPVTQSNCVETWRDLPLEGGVSRQLPVA